MRLMEADCIHGVVWFECAKCDAEEVCGESYDHDLRVIDERDGTVTYECRNCGAEIIERMP